MRIALQHFYTLYTLESVEEELRGKPPGFTVGLVTLNSISSEDIKQHLWNRGLNVSVISIATLYSPPGEFTYVVEVIPNTT